MRTLPERVKLADVKVPVQARPGQLSKVVTLFLTEFKSVQEALLAISDETNVPVQLRPAQALRQVMQVLIVSKSDGTNVPVQFKPGQALRQAIPVFIADKSDGTNVPVQESPGQLFKSEMS